MVISQNNAELVGSDSEAKRNTEIIWIGMWPRIGRLKHGSRESVVNGL